MKKPEEVLIATVGLSPQVVTLALDELLRRKVPIRRVIVVQPSEAQEAIKCSLDRLRAEIADYRQQRGITFEFRMFEDDDGYRPSDTQSRRDADIVLKTLNRELRAAKQAGCRVHLSIAGGRKIISAFGTVAAQLQFEADDQCWHVIEGTQADREAMHPRPGEEVRLVEVPILSWKVWKETHPESLLTALADDPLHAQEILRRVLVDEVIRRRCDFFLTELDHTEQRVLALMALEGLDNDELCARLGCSVKNVVTRILTKYAKQCKRPDVHRGHLTAEFQVAVLSLQREGRLPDLTPAGAAKKPRKT